MKLKKLAKCSLATALIFGSVGAISGCKKDNNTTEKTEQEKTYDLYVQYMNAKGDTPLTYEQWLVSIKGEKGEDGISPKVRINENTNYWEISTDNGTTWNSTGVKATGAEGEKGDPGDDAIAPQVRINQTTNYWEISTDNGTTWTSTGVKATGAEGEAGHTPAITIGQNGNWYVDGVDTTIKAQGEKGEDATYGTYTITYDYNLPYQMDLLFDNYKATQTIKSTEWITSMPTIKENNVDAFGGWYIKDTNKKIDTYDFIGGNVTLVAKWKTTPKVPSGLYQNGVYVKTWEELKSSYNIFKDDTISGYSYSQGPEGDLVIDESILTIGSHAFANDNLTSVLIGKNVTSIAEVAFDGCEDLEAVYFDSESKLQTIGMGAFENCINLKEIEIPSSVKSIALGAFHGCHELSNVKLNEGLESIASAAFAECNKLTSITIPSSVTSIGYNAFRDCPNLENIFVNSGSENFADIDGVLFDKDKVTLIKYPMNHSTDKYVVPESVVTIEDSAFTGCKNLTRVEFLSGLTTIKEYAFSHCENLLQVIISDTVSSIDDTAFIGCSSMHSFHVNYNNEHYSSDYISEGSNALSLLDKNKTKLIYAAKANSLAPSIYIPDTVTTINKYAFSTCFNLEALTLGELVENIDTYIFETTPNLERIYVNQNNLNYTSDGKCLLSKDGTTLIWGSADCVIPDTVTKIAKNAFSGRKGLTTIVIPNSVKVIEERAFENCTDLTSVTIGEGVKTIGKMAFYNCSSLVTIYYNAINANDLTNDDAIFERCAWNASLIIGNKVTYIPAYLLEGNSHVYNVTFGTEVVTIGEMAFHGTGITAVTLPEKLKTIGANAFSNSKLTQIIIPNSVQTIDGRAFADCSKLKQVTIGTGVKSINGTAFSNIDLDVLYYNAVNCSAPSSTLNIFKSSSITKLVIGDSVTSIPSYLFYGTGSSYSDCLTIKEIVLGSNLTYIGSNSISVNGLEVIVFNNAYALENINLSPVTIYINSELEITALEGYTLQQNTDREGLDMWIKNI